MTDCLDEGRVLEFLTRTLPAPVRSEIEAHLASCEKCTELVTWAAAELADPSRSVGREGRPFLGRLEPGSRVGRYQVLGAIGRGAMGEVYAAYHPDLDRRIALKLVNEAGASSDEHRQRLLLEARVVARMSHPNVIAVYDAGTLGDSVYIAMEFVDGQTVADWLRTPRPWRETLQVFLAAGKGLAAAHAAGVVHRDFKPQNVMIAKGGSVRVMDFGLARLAQERGAERGAEPATAPAGPEAPAAVASTVTRSGAVVGTPAYMAPEQFTGERGDARSDQFSFCVALYEGLYGERPFPGEDILSLSVNVTEERVRPLPKDRDVPARIRRAVLTGLKSDPAARWPSMAALIAALENDPAAKLRRRLLAAGAIALAAVTLLVARQMVTARRNEAERDMAGHIEHGRQAASAAEERVAAARDLRRRSFAAFDALDKDEGESLWRQTRALVPAIDASFEESARAYEAAAILAPGRDEIRERLGDVRYEHLLFGEDFRLVNRIEVLAERLAAADFDGSRRKAHAAPGRLVLRTTPVAARVVLERYERDPSNGRRVARPLGPVDAARSTTTLPPGSYRLLLDGPGLAHVAYPFEITRGSDAVVEVSMPAASAVPAGFAYIPAGEFWFGDADEQLRSQFFEAVPMHHRRTNAYLIAERESTYAAWIAFLESLPAAERARHSPDISGATRGLLRLTRDRGSKSWRFTFQPTTARYSAEAGEPIRYLGRKQRAVQDWEKFPVAGVDASDVEAYATWLRNTNAVPGARLCTELEWERAARGGDDRLFPHGDELAPDDADFGPSYGRVDAAYGPDEVGTHPGSRSPFGVDDLAGNAMEIVISSQVPDQLVVRGGAYYFDAISCRSTNRNVVPHGFRDVTAGVRICASVGTTGVADDAGRAGDR